MKYKILLVEDDKSLGLSSKKFLESEGFEVIWAESLQEAHRSISIVHLIVLDWMLPDGQGIDLLKSLRSKQNRTPVIMLTARVDLIDKIVGLESGANDYMTKPFEPRELIARIRVQLRTPLKDINNDEHTILKYESISLNIVAREVIFEGNKIEMTKMEFELLKLLLEKPGRVFTREEILNKVWGYENFPTTRTVDTHILQIRQKTFDGLIETIRGIGYRLKI
jgi:DNA-binding response OmpR family regulator